MNTQKICVRGVDQRKLELMLYEKFGHDCSVLSIRTGIVTRKYYEVQARRPLTTGEIMELAY
ncbi:hypothetical protein VUR80DRAFT_2882 [Thermomyces stellatus]